jgi:MFS family permease
MEHNTTFEPLRINNTLRYQWDATARWALFFAIVGFVVAGLYLITMAFAGTVINRMGENTNNTVFMSLGNMGVFAGIMMFIAGLYTAASSYFLLRFSQQIQQAMQYNNQAAFVDAWSHMRIHFRINGIALIVLIVFYIAFIAAMGMLVSKSLQPF